MMEEFCIVRFLFVDGCRKKVNNMDGNETRFGLIRGGYTSSVKKGSIHVLNVAMVIFGNVILLRSMRT